MNVFLCRLATYMSRKFVLAGLALGGSFYLAATGKDMGGWIGSITPILAFFIGGNSYQDWLASKRGEAPKDD